MNFLASTFIATITDFSTERTVTVEALTAAKAIAAIEAANPGWYLVGIDSGVSNARTQTWAD